MYEQGINPDYERTALAHGTSLAIHESQSRMWENLIGRSLPFWEFFYPQLKKVFPSQLDMGVITPAGVVGRVVKTTGASSVVLLVTDPNNAIAGLIQRTRDEGIVEGTQQGLAQLKYIPLLSTLRDGDRVVTSGLVGGFPRGLAIGTITRIDKQEGALFQSAELMPEVDVGRVEEVLVIQASYGQSTKAVGGVDLPGKPSP